MKPLKIRDLTLDSGRPKICVSLTEKTKETLIEAAKDLFEGGVDLIEWRVDFFDHYEDETAVKDILSHLRSVIGNSPLLFTFRTKEEGGNAAISTEDYENLNRCAIESAEVDLIDLELFRGETLGSRLIALAHSHGKFVIMSNHDFDKTPAKVEILHRLSQMKSLGSDLVKIALMPNHKLDVLTLMEASIVFSEANPELPLVTMSMGKDGLITRMAGQFTGSVITFGAGKIPSAPGQLPAKDLLSIVEKINS